MDDTAQRFADLRQKLARCRAGGEEPRPADAQTVLRERARLLARKIAPPEAEDVIEVVRFRCGGVRMAVEAAWVREVLTPRQVVAVPGTPPFIAGIINHRGSILSVVDLREFLALPATAADAQVVLYLGDGEMEFGLLIDEVEAALPVPRRAITAAPPTVPETTARYLRGVLPGAVALLDAGLLLATPQLQVE